MLQHKLYLLQKQNHKDFPESFKKQQKKLPKLQVLIEKQKAGSALIPPHSRQITHLSNYNCMECIREEICIRMHSISPSLHALGYLIIELSISLPTHKVEQSVDVDGVLCYINY